MTDIVRMLLQLNTFSFFFYYIIVCKCGTDTESNTVRHHIEVSPNAAIFNLRKAQAHESSIAAHAAFTEGAAAAAITASNGTTVSALPDVVRQLCERQET